MVINAESAVNTTLDFIGSYLEMDILGFKVNCPYWSNKIKTDFIIRGYENGKGDPESIRNELVRLLKLESDPGIILGDSEKFRKFALRFRIGIDCSGFVYRVLDFMSVNGFSHALNSKLEDFYLLPVTRTNADRLTSREFVDPVSNVKDIRFGDLIRIEGGKHVAVITGITDKEITYTHSSGILSEMKGVHKERIGIINPAAGLQFQNWLEKTASGENFGKKYFNTKRGDGIFRLKIFN